ncbi:mechanosensitive ion channel domain-containing protein [Microbacterium sp. 2FI]|uniref:mechanosensitive ion channel family protein n=1 Tax=Microbacterium sp. 2FI TaxID=2502193 RepID=UPI0010FA15D4|nr:mechanosensitive ion channel domain-containing protein [Microbacterium sp. 2FI]
MDFSALLTGTISGWDVLFAALAVIAGWIASRFAKKGAQRVLVRVPNVTPAMVSAGARIAQYTVLFLGIGLALAFLGANVQPLLVVALIVTAIVLLVVRGVADNFAASVLIQTRKPVVVGEEIMVEGPDGAPLVGTVVELNSRAVIFETFDGRTAHVPNSKLLAETLVNHSRKGARRSEVQVRLERGEASVDDVVTAVTDAAASVHGVFGDAAPRTLLTAVSADRVRARVQFWHDPQSGISVTSDVVQGLTALLAARGWTGTVTSEVAVPPLIGSDSV